VSERVVADAHRGSLGAAPDARGGDDTNAGKQLRQLVEEILRAGHPARERLADADRQRARRRLALLHHVEVVIEGRDLVDLGERESYLLRERREMRGCKVAVAVVDPVKMLDQ